METHFPQIAGFFSGLSVLGGVAAATASFAVKAYFRAASKTEDLERQAIKAEIKAAEQRLRLVIEKQLSQFRAIEASVDKYEVSVRAMRTVLQRTEDRIESYHSDLKKIKKQMGLE